MNGRPVRVVENLNHALHESMLADSRLYVLGEDIADPYGGAFKATRGLSQANPDRVITTPISENGIVGVAAGLAMAGDAAIVEIMFGDFAGLAFDQLLNFASKSVSMYGRPHPMRLVVRCPSGGSRGYGPTHSQTLLKHFIGIPGLSLFEMSPFHDNRAVLAHMLGLGEPCVFIEDKVLYTRRMAGDGQVDDLFDYGFLGAGDTAPAHVYTEAHGDVDCLIIAPGGMAERALAAMRDLLLRHEISCRLVVPSRLYPVETDALLDAARHAAHVCVVEESTAGGTWGAEVAHVLHERLWGRLRRPVRLVHSADSVIPTAVHLEREILVQADTIVEAVLADLRGEGSPV
ncbi:pyruvate dehydrogenase [Lentzea sp. NBRC 105346]|uniref:alpha-ketoacid dehydrogenase subunit beta n=1 Tax=Lentzea sp. NBRC 105346 TaxID=3032205 RepID=UPI0024A249BE|nr:transketolase C-terminal domain-containing protein [Lentzea sp. NBRC 105346]GLZ31996.1 pyruvate dehydrogenase [Lentzea sp. NBRC 105346]